MWWVCHDKGHSLHMLFVLVESVLKTQRVRVETTQGRDRNPEPWDQSCDHLAGASP